MNGCSWRKTGMFGENLSSSGLTYSHLTRQRVHYSISNQRLGSCRPLANKVENCDIYKTRNYYFTSTAVAVDSSHMTASSSALRSRFSPPSNFVKGARVDNVVHGLSLATITGR